MNTNKIICKIVGVIILMGIVAWFWPMAFHKPIMNHNKSEINSANDIAQDGYEVPVTKTPYDPGNPDPIAPPHSADEVNDPVACTMEAKMCPDGSYVGRQGPNCEFSPCPTN